MFNYLFMLKINIFFTSNIAFNLLFHFFRRNGIFKPYISFQKFSLLNNNNSKIDYCHIFFLWLLRSLLQCFYIYFNMITYFCNSISEAKSLPTQFLYIL